MRSDFLRLAFALIVAGVAAACAKQGDAEPEEAARTPLVIETSQGARHAFEVEIADDPREQSKGLMFRTSLGAREGMLFDHGSSPRVISMWMKNTYISLDMAFIDQQGVIVTIAEHTTPHSLDSISSGRPVSAVLEVNAGTFETLGIDVGDRVEHEMFAKP